MSVATLARFKFKRIAEAKGNRRHVLPTNTMSRTLGLWRRLNLIGRLLQAAWPTVTTLTLLLTTGSPRMSLTVTTFLAHIYQSDNISVLTRTPSQGRRRAYANAQVCMSMPYVSCYYSSEINAGLEHTQAYRACVLTCFRTDSSGCRGSIRNGSWLLSLASSAPRLRPV